MKKVIAILIAFALFCGIAYISGNNPKAAKKRQAEKTDHLYQCLEDNMDFYESYFRDNFEEYFRDEIGEAYQRGYDEGYEWGFDVGYDNGKAEGQEAGTSITIDGKTYSSNMDGFKYGGD